jgi:uncharacterized membrane protein SirB2
VIEYYPYIRQVHIASVVISLTLFALRGGMMLAELPLRRHILLRVLPHAVDTVLLSSALMLSYLLRQYPFVHSWLTAKIFGLIAYIVLGSIALRHGRTRGIRAAAFVAALAAAGYIVNVALTRSPLGVFAR